MDNDSIGGDAHVGRYREYARDLASRLDTASETAREEAERRIIEENTPSDGDPILCELREFLRTLGVFRRNDEPFSFYAKMRHPVREMFAQKAGEHLFPDGIFGRVLCDTATRMPRQDEIPPRLLRDDILLPFDILLYPWEVSAGRKREYPRLAQVYAKMRTVNRLGFDIYVCPNPVSHGRHFKKCVQRIYAMAVEFDRTPIEKQREFVTAVSSHSCVAVHSGGESIHTYLRFLGHIDNPHFQSFPSHKEFTEARKRGELGKCPRIPEYDFAVSVVEQFAVEHGGLKPDPSVYKDWSTLARCPGFEHTGSGNLSRTVEGSLHFRTSFDPSALNATLKHPVRVRDGWDEIDDDCGDATLTTSTEHLTPASAPRQDARHTAREPPAGTTAPRTTPLLVIERYQVLRRDGIPEVGTRRHHLMTLVNVAWIFGWIRRIKGRVSVNRQRIGRELRAILTATLDATTRPPRMEATREEATTQFADLLARIEGGSIPAPRQAWPDCKALPVLGKERVDALKERIGQLIGSGEMPLPSEWQGEKVGAVARGAQRVVTEILYERLRTHTRHCRRGTLSVPARAIQGKCIDGRMGAVKAWLILSHLMQIRKGYSKEQARTYRYWVNAPLILHLLGFRHGDIRWYR